MKTTAFQLLFIVVLAVSSCTEPTDMLTVINADGSCYREFTECPDSAFLTGDFSEDHNPFPAVVDSTWEFAWRYKDSELRKDFPIHPEVFDTLKDFSFQDAKLAGRKTKDEIVVFARKNYKSVEEMDTTFHLKASHSWSDLKVKHHLETKFRWFYTYYTYRETYPKIETEFNIPVDKYMTADEATWWFTGQPDITKGMIGVEVREFAGNIENKFQQWYNDNLWSQEYKVLLVNYKLVKNAPVSETELAGLQDSIFNTKVKDTEDFKMEQILDDFFQTKAFSAFWNEENSPMTQYESDRKDSKFMKYFEKEFAYKLILPGKIIQPNNAIVQGDTLVWKLSAYRLIPADYVIEAQSRKANTWAFLLTGIIVLLAIGSFIWKPKRY